MKNLDFTKNEITQREQLPNIVIEDFYLQVALGKWLCILHYNYTYRVPKFSYKLGIASWFERILVKKKETKEIKRVFGKILCQAGFKSSGSCMINGYNETYGDHGIEISFNCSFEDLQDSIQITLEYGDGYTPQFVINGQNFQKVYDYNRKQEQLYLRTFTIKNPANGNFVKQNIFKDLSFVELNNNQNHLSVQVGKPENQKYDSLNGFRLGCEKELEQYLLSLSFPVAIEQVYKKVFELLNNSIDNYPAIQIVIGKYGVVATDLISLEKGELVQFTKTKDGKKISLSNNGKWTYESDTLTASNDIFMAFKIRATSSKELTEALLPAQEFENVSEEVEKMKKLVKSIF